MMRDVYSKWCLLILILGVAILSMWCEWPQWQLYSDLRKIRQNKHQLLQTYQARYINRSISMHQKSSSLIHETPQMALEALLSVVQKSGLILLAVQPQHRQDRAQDLFPVFLKVNGHFSDVLQFLQFVQRSNQPIVVEHLQIESSADVLSVTFHLSLYLYRPIANDNFLLPLKKQDPFCSANTLTRPTRLIDDDKLLQQLSLSQIKMLGVMQNGFERVAWLGLPDGRMVSVGLHDIICQEQGNIVAIHQHSMQILLPNQKIVTLTL